MTELHSHESVAAFSKTYSDVFTGKFFGILRWEQLDELWLTLKNTDQDDWYIYALGEQPPSTVSSAEDLVKFITEIDILLHQEHDEDYCGIVYADDIQAPTFIKIFDPNNIGTSCSIATKAPLPGWILSKVQPSDLVEANKPTANRRRWWQKLIS